MKTTHNETPIVAETENTKMLSLPEIAAWQVDDIPAHKGTVVADLPALQRGAVWKVQQIEELWDSVLRDFPIGSFILSRPNATLLRQDFKLQTTNADKPPRPPTHLLLDGQQRATAIALAFDDIWLRKEDAAKAALWVDLAAAPSGRQVAYVFRVLTRAHPWGYRRSNPQDTLGVSAIREALNAWQAANENPHKKPDEFPLWATWPWDCIAPVPMAPLLASLDAHPQDLVKVRAALWERLQNLPILSLGADACRGATQATAQGSHAFQQKNALQAAFTQASTQEYQRLDRLLKRLQDVLHGASTYRVPALTLKLTNFDDENLDVISEEEANTQIKDAIELLFVRINSAGTPLAGEELAYSLLKAEWPEVAQWMQALPNKPALPSRIAALCIRLVMARTVTRKESHVQATLPAMPGMQEFRRLLRNENPGYSDFRRELARFITDEATGLFNTAWKFLTATEKRFTLLPVQAVDMAQHAPDVYLLLLRWLDRLAQKGTAPKDLSTVQHQRTLGFLSALAWFSPDKNRACAAVWPHLEIEVDISKLKDRFNGTRLREACKLSERGALRMIPLPSPDELEAVCRRFMEEDGRTIQTKAGATLHSPKGNFWKKDGNWWYEQLVPTLARALRDNWETCVTADTTQSDDTLPDYAALVQQIAGHFLDTLWDAKSSVLLYAQREAVKEWFPRFDPSLPEMMEDRNRPWDWDHLLPQSYFSGRHNIPCSVKDWGNSIGNLRAWPLEANRSDGDFIAKAKLSNTTTHEEQHYKIGDGLHKRQASFVSQEIDWPHWENAAPTDEAGNVSNKNYLSNNASSSEHQYRIDAVTAMIKRFNALYRHWYVELKLKDLTT